MKRKTVAFLHPVRPTPLTPNIGIIIKYSRLTITITAKILRPNPHLAISGKVGYFYFFLEMELVHT